MSRLVGDVKLQTQCLKNGSKVRDSARTNKVNTPGLLSAETLNIYAESTCNFEKVVVRKVERKFEFTSLSATESFSFRIRYLN